MPKRVFFPLAIVVCGLIVLASNIGMLPREFWNLWPLMFIIVGLGGLLLSDKEEWDVEPNKKSVKPSAPASSKKTVAKKSVKKTTSKKK